MVPTRGEQRHPARKRPVAGAVDVAYGGQVLASDADARLLKIAVVVVPAIVVCDVADADDESSSGRADQRLDGGLISVHGGGAVGRRVARGAAVGRLAEVADN